MRVVNSLILSLCTATVLGAQSRTPPPPPLPRPSAAPRPAIAPRPVLPASPAIWGLAPEAWERVQLDFDRAQMEWEHSQLAWDRLSTTLDVQHDFEVAHDLATTFATDFVLQAPPALAPRDFDLRWPALAGTSGTEPQDSLYRAARELLSRGEYRRASALFAELAEKHSGSNYAPDAMYWQAFALYRIGGTNELRVALQALETQGSKYPNARTKVDARALSTRIRGALAARGDASAAAALRQVSNDSGQPCDQEEQSVRVEALKAVSNSDPEGSAALLNRTLSRRDECSTSLRRTAVFLIGNSKQSSDVVSTLAGVARNDPSDDVRSAALDWLSRMPGDDALAVIESISRDSDNERMQRAAVRALVRHPSARARVMVRGLVDREETPERLRLEALDSFSKERTSAEDIAWMRTLYDKTSSRRLKSRLVSTVSKVGGDDSERWLLGIAKNEEEDSETRSYALRRVAETQPIAELARLYDGAAQRSVRSSLIDVLGRRTEEAATDKLIDIVKNGTDPQLRSSAISALTRKKDPRTVRLLMELINR